MIRLMIADLLKRLLALFDDKPAKIEAWPFPVEQAPKPKRKPTVKKATTRKLAVKKPVIKKAK
jgi:hypothetical protein